MTEGRQPDITRRTFLGGLAGAGVVAASWPRLAGPSVVRGGARNVGVDLPSDPFTLGVASGDPLPDRVVLWTRLAPDPMDTASVPATEIPVRWEVATDERFTDVVRKGRAIASPAAAHSIHADAEGLRPARDYWYRFRVGAHTSPVGRTRTAPAANSSPRQFGFAVASCQGYQTGLYTAYRHLAEDDVDVVFFVGDYIYELEASRQARSHDLPVARTVDEFRRFYALNRTDADLQAAHAAHPWVVTWDDHEVEDNYAALEPGAIGRGRSGDFAAVRAAAYQAWWEHMPLRMGPPKHGSLRIYRSLRVGDLATAAVLDNRQYRSPIPTGAGAGNLPRGAGGGPLLPAALDENATYLGREQERWLERTLRRSRARWNVVVQQTVMAQFDRAPADEARGFSADSWDGYVAARRRLLEFVREGKVRNFVSVGGDIHSSLVTDLRPDYAAAGSPVVGSELVGPSITALEILPPEFVDSARTNPHVHYYDIERHGYLRCRLDRQQLRGDYRYVDSITTAGAPVTTGSSWIVRSGRPGAGPA
jgi:alkaline phosphatase D